MENYVNICKEWGFYTKFNTVLPVSKLILDIFQGKINSVVVFKGVICAIPPASIQKIIKN